LLPSAAQYHYSHLAHYVRDLVQKDIDKTKDEEKKAAKERDDVEKRMKKLKAVLYNKFGNAINLEE